MTDLKRCRVCSTNVGSVPICEKVSNQGSLYIGFSYLRRSKISILLPSRATMGVFPTFHHVKPISWALYRHHETGFRPAL